MTTKAEREAEMLAAEETVLLQIWDDDATRWDAYQVGAGPIEIRYNLWYSDGQVIRRDVAHIVVFDAKTENEAAEWFGAVPSILRPDPVPSEFETKLAAKVASLLGGSMIVRIKVEELDIADTFAIARVFSIDGTNVKMQRYFAYLGDDGMIKATPYSEA